MTLLTKLKRLDLTILFLLFLLMIVSYFIVDSATFTDIKLNTYARKQVIFFVAGFFLLLCVALFDYRYILKYAWFGYIGGILLLVGLYVLPSPIALTINNARGWYNLGPLLFQPAELMKFLLIITVSAYMVKRRGEKLEFLRDVLPIGFIGLIPFAIIAMLPDLGNAVILLVIMIGLYWIGNIKFSHVLIGVTAITLVVGGFVFAFTQYHEPVSKFMENVGGRHWVGRIDTFLGQNEDAQGSSYHSIQAKQAIATGKLSGEGYKKGPNVQGGNVPFVYSDAIFVIVAEEFGFVGSAVLLMLFFFLIYRMIVIAMECQDRGGGYLIIGIVTLYVFQIFQNIGMFIGLMPITGITLPFVSYGGTSLLINMLAMGLVLSAKIHGDKSLDSDDLQLKPAR